MDFDSITTPFSRIVSCFRSSWVPANQNEDIVTIIRNLLVDHDMISTDHASLCTTNKELETHMQEIIEETHSLPTGGANKIVPLHLAAGLIELAYPKCTFTKKLNIALLHWYLLYIDNESPKDITPYMAFEERFFRNLPQLNPFLDGLASCLHKVFDLYPTLFASSIINSIFDSIVGTCTEPSIEKMESPRSSTLFPWFLRQRNGAAVAYALMMFPKTRQIDFVACFQVLADMEFWIAGVNDILSYYKESIAGETANYISNRAIVEAKAPLKVASDIREEILQSRNNIYTTLANTGGREAVEIWQAWEHGFITWHLQQKRYRLRELGL